MPRKKKNVQAEFQIERIGEDNIQKKDIEPRSLVFKISKRAPESEKNTQLSSDDSKETDQNMNISSERLEPDSSISIMNIKKDISGTADGKNNSPLKLKVPKSLIQFEESKAPELRRTSRRIILRVNKDIPDDSKATKFEKPKKVKRRVSSTAFMKMNGGIKRGPGRPRKNIPQVNVPNFTKQAVSFTDSKSSTSKPTKSSNVWTLVPKEIVDSEFFKSHIIKMHYPRQPGRKPKSLPPLLNQDIPSLERPHYPIANCRKGNPFLDHQNIPPERKQVLYQERDGVRKCSTRPTVIYFKPTKNNSDVQKENIPYVPNKRSNHLDIQNKQTFSSKEQWDKSYLRCKYSNVANEEFLYNVYDACYGNLQKTEEQLSKMLFKDQNLVEECDGYHKTLNLTFKMPDSTFCGSLKDKENSSEDGKDTPHESSPSNQSNFQEKDDVDTLCCQAIVESIKILYDDEAVLGCHL